jgi:hypothetical protein
MVDQARREQHLHVNVQSDREAPGIPLMPSVARRIILELLEREGQWKRSDLAKAVAERHRESGGTPGTQSALAVVKKALQYLRDDGAVENVAPGMWRKREIEGDASDSGTLLPAQPVIPEEEEYTLAPEKVIGEGSESVYLYFNPNDRRLAEAEGREVWECKIGRTTAGTVLERIMSQGTRTSLSHTPVIGLVIKTSDSAALEKALHASLRLADTEVADSPGTEWFLTCPERVEAWFEAVSHALVNLRIERTGPAARSA